jgi:hypothetical protein
VANVWKWVLRIGGLLAALTALLGLVQGVYPWIKNRLASPAIVVREAATLAGDAGAFRYRLLFSVANRRREPVILNGIELREGAMELFVVPDPASLPIGTHQSVQIQRRVDALTLHLRSVAVDHPDHAAAPAAPRTFRLFGPDRIQLDAGEQLDHVLLLELLPPAVAAGQSLQGFDKEIVLAVRWEATSAPGAARLTETHLTLRLDRAGPTPAWQRWLSRLRR